MMTLRCRKTAHCGLCVLCVALWPVLSVQMTGAQPLEREVIEGVTTTRSIPGKPYDLAGNRIVFTNWYHVNPGDLDWRDSTGKSVYVHGNSDLFEAQHVGINAPWGIQIVAHKPRIIGPIDMPVHRCFVRDGDLYRGWSNNAYYESRDAMSWEKKADLSFEGTSDDGVYHVFIDPSSAPAERFKAVWSSQITRAEFDEFRRRRPDGWEPRALLHTAESGMVSCLRGGVSSDGIHWKVLPDPLVVEYADTLNTCYYDTTLRQYVLYTRCWSVGPASQNVKPDIRHCWTDVGRRAIGRSESHDFRAFPPSQQILEPTPEMMPSEQLYTNCRTAVPGAPDQHLMFPAIWNGSIDDTTRIALASSHDGKTWHWLPGGSLMETGAFGQWNGGCIWAIPELLELPNGDWALPYLAHNLPHKYPRGRQVGRMGYAIWPKGRLVSLHAPQSGQFTTIPVIAKGNVLKVNALTRRTGWIRVELVGGADRGIDACDPIVGDQFWQPITWKGSRQTGVPPGTPVTLRFELYQADLFGIEFAQE